jgi:hypothetical protein
MDFEDTFTSHEFWNLYWISLEIFINSEESDTTSTSDKEDAKNSENIDCPAEPENNDNDINSDENSDDDLNEIDGNNEIHIRDDGHGTSSPKIKSTCWLSTVW